MGADPTFTLRFEPEDADKADDEHLPTSFAPLLSSSHLTTKVDFPPDVLHEVRGGGEEGRGGRGERRRAFFPFIVTHWSTQAATAAVFLTYQKPCAALGS